MLNSNKNAWQDFALQTQQNGYAALAIYLRRHGQSDGDRNFAALDEDVNAALNWLNKQGDVDRQRMGIIGASIEENLALRGGAIHSKIKSFVLLSSGLDYRGITTAEALEQYQQRPSLFIASEGDSYSVQSVERLAKIAGGSGTTKIYPGSAHGTSIFQAQPNLTTILLNWLEHTL